MRTAGRPRGRAGWAAALAGLLATSVLAGCSSDGRDLLPPPGPDQTLSIITTTTAAASTTTTAGDGVGSTEAGDGATTSASDANILRLRAPWAEGGAIDTRFTCAGTDLSPSFSWTGVPADAVELALLVTDLDSNPPGFVHWMIAGIDPASTGIAEGRVPAGAAQALNGFGQAGWTGPCPPSGTHTYLTTLYALRQKSGITSGASGGDLLGLLETRASASAAVTGTFAAVPGASAPATTPGATTAAGQTTPATTGPTSSVAPGGTITIKS